MLRRLALSGLTDGQIGKAMGRHRVMIAGMRRAMNIEAAIPAKWRAMMNRINMRRRAMARAT